MIKLSVVLRTSLSLLWSSDVPIVPLDDEFLFPEFFFKMFDSSVVAVQKKDSGINNLKFKYIFKSILSL